MVMEKFLEKTKYVDYDNSSVVELSKKLFTSDMTDVEKAEKAFIYVRDAIDHTFDIRSDAIVASASDVISCGVGICHSKANLLAALLRAEGIPTGFSYQYLTLADNDELGYCLHCFNAIYLNGKWIKVDARGNKNGINAEFSLDEPKLAFACREQYGEYFIKGIYSSPHQPTMDMLECSTTMQNVLDCIPCERSDKPDIEEYSKTT